MKEWLLKVCQKNPAQRICLKHRAVKAETIKTFDLVLLSLYLIWDLINSADFLFTAYALGMRSDLTRKFEIKMIKDILWFLVILQE